MPDAQQRRRAQELHDTAVALGATCGHRDHQSSQMSALARAAVDDPVRPGWPAGAPDGEGGEFRPKDPGFLSLDEIPADSPKRPVAAVDSAGKPILGDGDKPILRPADLSPEFFVQQGLALKARVEEATKQGTEAVLGEYAGGLAHFAHGNPWDAQRVNGLFVREYRDYATIAIGVYCAAAGMPRDVCLSYQNAYAVLSSFSKDEKKDDIYTRLPERNVRNTDRGYALFESGQVTAEQ